MTQNDDTRDEELLARYRRAGADAPGPSEAVRAAILAESRRVADELAKQTPRQPFDVSRPAANDSRWKITAFGTAGAALLAALLFAPRYWENAPPAQMSMAPPPAPAPASISAPASQAPSESTSLQEIVVTRADRKSAKTYGAPSPQHDTAAPPAAGRLRSSDLSAGAANDALSVTGGSPSRAESLLKPATLQSAVAQGDVAQAATLLDQGAVIDARDEAGRTPLMLAVTQDRLEIVRLLLVRGADPNAADNTGRTPLQQARLQNSREIAALLEGWQRARSTQ
jgi:hypothetical protein